MDIKKFLKKYGDKIKINCKRVDRNPHMEDFNADHWKVTLKMGGRQFTTYFSQGYAFDGKEPELKLVLETFLNDIDSISEGLDNFIIEYGYEECYKKGERIFKTIEKTEERLKRLMGSDYDDFVSYD